MLAFDLHSRPSSASSPIRSRRPRSPLPRTAALASAACLALVLSACGGVDDALASASAASSASAGVSGLQLSAPTIAAGAPVTGTVTLADTARNTSGGVTVYLSFSRTVFAGPQLIRIPNGSRSGSFTLRSNPYLGASTAALVVASTSSPDPFSMMAQQVTVAAAAPQPATPRPDVASVTFSPATVPSGQVATGTVTLTGAAPAGGAVVQLSNGNDRFGQVAEVPATVLVPEGAASVAFAVPTHLAAGTTQTDLPITGSYFGGPWRGSWLTVVAP
jgi:hypothetical protein